MISENQLMLTCSVKLRNSLLGVKRVRYAIRNAIKCGNKNKSKGINSPIFQQGIDAVFLSNQQLKDVVVLGRTGATGGGESEV